MEGAGRSDSGGDGASQSVEQPEMVAACFVRHTAASSAAVVTACAERAHLSVALLPGWLSSACFLHSIAVIYAAGAALDHRHTSKVQAAWQTDDEP